LLVTLVAAVASSLITAAPANKNGPNLGLDLTDKPPESGAVLLIPWNRAGKLDAAAHARVAAALEVELPGRVVTSEATLQAMAKEKLNAEDIRGPDPIYKLAHITWAYRAVTLDFRGHDVVLDIYDTDQRVLSQSVTVAHAGSLTRADAERIARTVASVVRAKQPAPEAEAELPPVPALPNEGEPERLQPLVPEAPGSPGGKSEVTDADLAEAMRGPQLPPPKPRPYRPPFIRLAVGPGVGVGGVAAHGEVAAGLAPIQRRAVPDLAVYLDLEPLHLAGNKVANAAWSDLIVEGTFRRGFAHASSVGPDGPVTCGMDDDEVMVRVDWRYRFQGAYVPQIGAGAGWGQDRLRFHCSLPVPSTSYRAFDVHLRILQPIIPRRFWVELVAGPRFAVVGDGASTPGPAVGGDFWVYGQITSYLFLRGGVRAATTRLAEIPNLTVNTWRISADLQLGASF
jgi:hypothetical protein